MRSSSTPSLSPRRRSLTALTALGAFVLAASAGCSSDLTSSSRGDQAPPFAAPPMFDVAHTNTRLDSPSFVWLARNDWPTYASAELAAIGVLENVAPTFRLRKEAMASFESAVVHDTGRGPIIARVAQRVDGVPVFRGGLNIVMSRAFAPVAISGLIAAAVDTTTAKALSRDAVEALRIAHRAMTGTDTTFTALDVQGDYQRFASASPSSPLDQPARAKRVYFPTRGGLEPAWYVELLLASGTARSCVVSAATGRVLFSNDLVRHDAYSYRVWASPDTLSPMDGPQGNATVPLVTPSPVGFKPTYVPQQLVTLQNVPFSKNDPWLLPGATTTQGNNVNAYSDVVRPDGLSSSSADASATTTSASRFDYPYDTATSAGTTPEAVRAAVTQMFYTTNFLHDWYYDAGFDEKSGNHQRDNFGRGGMGGDALFAETQDFSGRNNANAATPADGASPRIQMFLFGGPTRASLEVLAPASSAGIKSVGTAGQFGKDSFALTGQVVLAVDGAAPDASDACEPVTNGGALAGKIALVHRGNCSFVTKAQAVQAAGAVGVIVGNVASSAQPGSPPFMGGTASDVGIAALSLSLADAQALEAALGAAVSVTMTREASQDLDGALDNAIVAHEWGHVLSNRLVADGSGLDTNQAGGLGEGWGDFSALMLSVRAEDAQVSANAAWAGVYPSASYASSGDSDFYFGIRRVPYSTDMKKDPLTFKHIANGTPLPSDVPISFGEEGSSNAEVHNTGEVWATMLWECYAALLRDRGLTFEQAQGRMKAYLVASLKLTPPSPTFLEARDAVLAAAYASDPQDFDLFWKAFAKRGAGVGAVGPGKDSSDNRGVVESFRVGNAATLVGATVTDDVISCDRDGILDEGEIGTLEVTVRNSGAGTLGETTATFTSKSPNILFANGGVVKLEAFKPFESRTVKVRTSVEGAAGQDPILVDVAVSDPSLGTKGPLLLVVPARHAADEAAQSSATDSVETSRTSWVVTSTDVTGTSIPWKRLSKDGNQSWFIPNPGEPADHQLTSRAFDVEGATFGLSFRHRWSFESSQRENKDFDGGVVELSTDAGKTWQDISAFGPIDYNVTLADDATTTMVLKGRKAFGNTSPGYPDRWITTNVNVTLKSPQASVKLRFRVGADDNTAAVGWEIDDIALTDVASLPFWSFVPHRDECSPDAPTADAGAARAVKAKTRVSLEGRGASPEGAPLGFTWRQVAGPPVTMTDRDLATMSFDAPAVLAPTTLTFALRANDGARLSVPSNVDVVVAPEDATTLSAFGGCGCRVATPTSAPRTAWPAMAMATAGLAALLRRRRRADEATRQPHA